MLPITARIRVFQIAKMMKAVSRRISEHDVLPTIFHSATREDEMLILRIKFAGSDEAGAFWESCCKAALPGREERRREIAPSSVK